MSDLRVGTVRWGPPTNWVSWSHGDPAGAREEAEALCGDPRALAAVMAAVERFEVIAATEIPGVVAAALWLPDPHRREPLATAVLRVLAPMPEGRWDMEETLEFARTGVSVARGTRLLDVAALPSRVVAGEAVLQIVDTAGRFRRRVSREWAWFILPAGTDRTVMCHVQSSALEHFDAIAEMTTTMANSVVVTLADA